MNVGNLVNVLLPPQWRWRFLLLLVILGAFVVLKYNFNPGIGRVSLDGDYYYQIARNVAEGNGLSTNVSLYNQGLKSFPHKMNLSPVWPLLLGYTGKVFGLRTTSAVLPEIIFILDLLLLYILANLLVRRGGAESVKLWILNGKVLDIGHLAVLVFGTNRVFFEFTSMPYTEGLGFLFLFGCLILADRAAVKRSLVWALATGVVAGVGFLARVQLAGLLVAIPLAYALVAIRGDRRFFLMAVLTGLGTGLAMVPWAIWLHTWMDPVPLNAYLGMGSLYETPELKYFSHTVKKTAEVSKLDMIKDGMMVAFSPDRKNAYTFSFSWIVYIVPLALAQFIAHTSEWKERFRRLMSAKGVIAIIIIVSTLVALYPIHSTKRAFFKPWLFGWRHGLPMMALVTLSLTYLLTHKKNPLGKLLAIVAVAGSLWVGGNNLHMYLTKVYKPDPRGPEVDLVEWLDAQDPKPTVITTHAQILSVFSRSYFHWADCKVHPKHTLALFDEAGADYVLIYQREPRCRFVKTLIKQKKIKKFKRFHNRWWVELWKRTTPEEEKAAKEEDVRKKKK